MSTQAQATQTQALRRDRPDREIEIRLDTDDQFVLPDLTGLAGVVLVQAENVQEVRAGYVDSADLALARRGATFQRRTGGSDSGWHLKLPAGKLGSIEVQRPALRSIRAVPDDLAALARAHLRGAEVAPVARIRTRRRVHRLIGPAGEVLAELVEDQVTGEGIGAELITAQRWREIDVKLVAGDRNLLAAVRALLEAAGARPAHTDTKLARVLGPRLSGLSAPGTRAGVKSAKHRAKQKKRNAAKKRPQTAGEIAVRYLATQVDALIHNDPQVRLETEDSVHQMRVATRRARTALATFRPLFVAGSVEPVRAELSWLADVLGRARDAEVMREHLKRDVAQLPDELVLGPVVRRIDLELQDAYRSAYDAVIEALDGDRYLSLLRLLETFVATPALDDLAGNPADAEVRRLVGKACRRVERRVADLGEGGADGRDERLHEVRIAAKRARYAAEAAQLLAGARAKRTAVAMEAVQETLGDHQDAVVEQSWLRDLGIRAFLANENGFTFGLLHGLTSVRAEHDEETFQTRWRQARRTARQWPG